MALRHGPAVVKQVVGADAGQRVARELTALRLAAAASPAVAPRLLGVDLPARMLVLEYLGGRPYADTWPVAYAQALATLHSAATRAAEPALPRWHAPTTDDVTAFVGLAQELGAATGAAVTEELRRCIARVSALPAEALLHGDPCPDNALDSARGLRFVDFERAALGPGLVELAYLRMAFPTCWCVARIPEPQLGAAEAAYGEVWQALTGRQPAGSLADACISWLIRGDALVEMAHRDGADHLAAVIRRDWKWGTATARGRLRHRLRVAAGVTAGAAELADVHRLLTELAERLDARWPGLAALPDRSTIRG